MPVVVLRCSYIWRIMVLGHYQAFLVLCPMMTHWTLSRTLLPGARPWLASYSDLKMWWMGWTAWQVHHSSIPLKSIFIGSYVAQKTLFHTSLEEASPHNVSRHRECLLPTTWVHVEAGFSPVKPLVKSVVLLMTWLELRETQSRGQWTCVWPVTRRNCEIIDVCGLKLSSGQ